MRRLFVYEFVSGGGFAGEALPPRLLSEGRAMLEALLADLTRNGDRRIVTTLDDRVSLEPPPGVEVVRIYPGTGLATFRALAAAADDAWLIAPETSGRLAELARLATELGATLVGANVAAIRFAGDKLTLLRYMAEAGIPVPRSWPTGEAARALQEVGFPLVVKPAVGAGCEGVGLAWDAGELDRLLRAASAMGQAIVQEFIEGTPASACILCGSGRPRPLSLNGQNVSLGASFSYDGGCVPLHHPLAEEGTALAVAACELVPGLAGFVGVDLVLSPVGPVLIEINPRLTTSYVGLRAATDLNLAELILAGAKRVDLRFPLPLHGDVEFTADGRVRALPKLLDNHRPPPTSDRRLTPRNHQRSAGQHQPSTGQHQPPTDDRPPPTGERLLPPTAHRKPNTENRKPNPMPPVKMSPEPRGPRVLGWDIGGANTKAALAVGESCRSIVRPYAVWENPDGLRDVLAAIAGDLACADLVGVTLTAELADCFQTKEEGVTFVLRALECVYPRAPVRVFTTQGRFRSLDEALGIPHNVASANWAASAHFLAPDVGGALLVDVGTTTTDIIPLVGGRVAARGTTDPERLMNGELVYSGAVRTPVCAIAGTVPFRGGRCRVAAELFAQAGDVHVWLGRLPPGEYGCRTPDGRGVTREECGARLARSICADMALLAEDEITRIAENLAGRQVRAVVAGVRQVRRRLGDSAPSLVLGAGTGAFLAGAAARRAGLEYRPLAELLGEEASRALPAVAVARLLQRDGR